MMMGVNDKIFNKICLFFFTGVEFLHTLPCYYCSLCDTFMRDKGEALRHPESKLHVSKYKVRFQLSSSSGI